MTKGVVLEDRDHTRLRNRPGDSVAGGESGAILIRTGRAFDLDQRLT
jgi:hypothetical protein